MEYGEIVFFVEQMVRLGMLFNCSVPRGRSKGRIIARPEDRSGGEKPKRRELRTLGSGMVRGK